MNCSCIGPTIICIGIESTAEMTPPIRPASSPTIAPSATSIWTGEFCWRKYAASTPPDKTQRQQQQLPRFTNGSADSTPMNNPPQKAGCNLSSIRDDLSFLHPGLRPHDPPHPSAARPLL